LELWYRVSFTIKNEYYFLLISKKMFWNVLILIVSLYYNFYNNFNRNILCMKIYIILNILYSNINVYSMNLLGGYFLLYLCIYYYNTNHFNILLGCTNYLFLCMVANRMNTIYMYMFCYNVLFFPYAILSPFFIFIFIKEEQYANLLVEILYFSFSAIISCFNI